MATISSGQIPQLIANAASKYGVPSNLAIEVAIQESGLNQAAVSRAGAIGIFQLEPATAADLGVDPRDALQNIDGGIRYLAQLLSTFGGNQAQALAAYNWGEGNVSRSIAANGNGWLAAAPGETQNYVASILAATGQNYSAAVTPGSLFSGAVDAITGDSTNGGGSAVAAPSDTFTVFTILTLLGLGAYLLSDLLLDN